MENKIDNIDFFPYYMCIFFKMQNNLLEKKDASEKKRPKPVFANNSYFQMKDEEPTIELNKIKNK